MNIIIDQTNKEDFKKIIEKYLWIRRMPLRRILTKLSKKMVHSIWRTWYMEYLSWQSRSKVIPIIILKIPIQEELKLTRITNTNHQRFQSENHQRVQSLMISILDKCVFWWPQFRCYAAQFFIYFNVYFIFKLPIFKAQFFSRNSFETIFYTEFLD